MFENIYNIRQYLTLFTARGVADQHPWGPQNAINWAIFIQIQSLTLPELELKGFQSCLEFEVFLTMTIDSREKCVF